VALILLAGATAFLTTLFGTRVAIRVLVARGYGQLIRDDGPTSHHVKRGTPTMGGAVIIVAVLAGYTVSHLAFWTPPTASGLLALFLMVGLGLVGFADDFIKVSKQRSLGLRSRPKLLAQAGVALAFMLLARQFPDDRGLTPVSDADTAVEEGLRSAIARACPRDAVLGEEFGAAEPAGTSGGRRWIIDPIDGTKNFIRGVPIWGTLIALMDEGVPVVSVVSAPALDRRWWAARDQGAYAGRGPDSATAIRVSGVRDLADA
jgi:hypothetical protein